MKKLFTFVYGILFISLILLSAIIYRFEQNKRIIKEDLVELSNIRYGLFSVDEWKYVAASIISDKIHELELSDENKEVMRKKISTFLYEVIEAFEARFYKEKSSSLGGIIQSGVASFTGTFGKLKKDIPVFTDQIIAFLDEAENREALRTYLIGQLNEYTLQTFAEIDYTQHNQIIASRGYNNRTDAIIGLNSEMINLASKNRPYKIALITILLITALLMALPGTTSKATFLVLIGISTGLLIPGILLPMIEIDARISELSFSLLGEQISFHDQVLFYQSKSILEIVGIMFGQRTIDLVFVGFLILAFSVLFPVGKLLASVLYICSQRMKQHKFINVLVFKTGKWSMADVMVIAIFMAYIGFNGIVTDQLHQIESLTTGVEILTTNNSSILSGFWFFTAFVLMSLLMSQKIISDAKPPTGTALKTSGHSQRKALDR